MGRVIPPYEFLVVRPLRQIARDARVLGFKLLYDLDDQLIAVRLEPLNQSVAAQVQEYSGDPTCDGITCTTRFRSFDKKEDVVIHTAQHALAVAREVMT